MRSFVIALLVGCAAPAGPSVVFEQGGGFWDMPFPSDLRLTADGRPDLAGFPNPRNLPVVNDLLSVAAERRGFSTMPIGWFQLTDDVAIDPSGALLIDLEDGASLPVVVEKLPSDAFGTNLVAIAPRPGIVLRGNARYAFVLTTAFAALARPDGFEPDEVAPLWDFVDEDDVVVATMFTTGDEVALLRARSEALREGATLGAFTATARADFCELRGTVTLPQYQRGAQPFDRDGRFELAADGTPIVQGTMTVPVVLTVPNGAMPARGWPLWQFFHGSGGASFDLVDDGPVLAAGGEPRAGEGPGVVVARRGIAAVAAALPVNPERLPGASNYAYLNLNNLGAFPYTFQQGVFEQRMLLDALLAAELPGCAGAVRFDATKLMAGGHSMGGMYANMIGAIEPRYGALTPFGAGGFWNAMILDTAIVPGSANLLAGVLGVEELSPLHPVLGMMSLGWEIAEPGVSMSRIARRPLDAAKHVYQPIGMDDQFFANTIFDAAALAYGNQQAGELVWPGTQDALRTDALDGMMQYPVRGNRSGTTSVVVQYTDGGILDAHYIHRQREEVRYQYACFLATYVRDGVPTVAAPAAANAPCPL